MENIEIDLQEKDLLFLAMEAHRRDITLNQLMNEIIREEMEKELENDT